ncbi:MULTISPECIES: cysteine desulfurase [Halobacterium]|uniref:cysteine desulfurase n=1 Tax=Halobacterium salinarum (strain ATCC 33171 / DSM 3754 / JCM 8978 / NBRC 102687 / NCIMB 764 / 91-R6) TaxID=2597657 RepID=A0A4D6GTN3_HALS9|nr:MULTISPECIES: cysteine desulfurase [Halobacterium]MDL0122565.1 cysteine desulfurase [Halobacterium salinarum]MDL0134154.1 cysteine desulfurase [Halobacterium salinarum]MDL0145158.1 cysteine desulfurase [Halobacterium salinarum]QCC43798.1 cysteine desulfurase [Halobacterium salinarum]QRY24668.1 cysteine desulfurase [Halobacterium sp. BOL4-2]
MEATEQGPIDVEAVRADFPILEREVAGGEDLVYLDNAATSHTPEPVVDAIADYYRRYNSNVHRGLHELSQEASVAYEDAHDKLAAFVGGEDREEMVFTKNTTEAENLVAFAWGLNELGPGDEVVLTQMEHHASLVTWQQVADETGAEVKYIPITDDGYLDMDAAADMITDDTALVNAVHISNTLGTVNPVGELADIAHDHGAYIFVDGAQAAPTRAVDVQEIDADFYAFSGHKMLGPTGIGCLYGKRHLLAEMEPFLYGGDMIERVSYEDATWNDPPWKFEAGTPVIAQGIALAEAVDYLQDIGMDAIRAHEEALTEYAYDQLTMTDDVDVYGPPGDDRGAVVSFNVDGIHAHDLSSILNDYGVAIRAGDHCTQPLHDTLGVPASARASFYLYNTRDEVDALVAAVDEARQIFAP